MDDTGAKADRRRPMAGACTCLAVRKAARRITQLYDDALAPSGLTIGQFGILGHVLAQPGAAVQAIATQMEMDQSTLSRLLRPLEAAGLLDIRVSAADARVRELRATEEGQSRFDAAAPLWRAAQARMEALLGPAHEALHTSLAAAVETIKAEERVG